MSRAKMTGKLQEVTRVESVGNWQNWENKDLPPG